MGAGRDGRRRRAGGYAAPGDVGSALQRLQRAVDAVVERDATGPALCMVATAGVPCGDPSAVRLRTVCRAGTLTPCSALVYACQSHRYAAATIVELRGVCVLHGANVDVTGSDVL